MNKIHTQRTLVAALTALAFGCSDSSTGEGSTTSPSGASTPGTPSTPGTAAPSTPQTAAAGSAAAAGRPASNTPATPASTGSAGSAAKPPTATTPSTPASAGSAAPSNAAGSAAPDAMASAGSSGSAAPAAGSGAPATPASSAGKLPRVMTTDGPGPYKEVVKVKNTPPGGWLIYPKEIGKDGVKHPLFVFGPGGGTNPMTYETDGMHWDRYGSYGFVIYCLPQSTGDGAAMKAGLDWLIKSNDDMASPLYQKLDTTKVVAAGHSMGSVTTFDFMPDDRVSTTIHISGGSFDGMGPSHLKKDTMFICGPDGNADVAQPQCDGDFKNSKVPTFYTNVQGSSHLTSGRLGWEAIIAWMLWHTADQEDQWKKEFVDPAGKFQKGIYKSQVKNW